VPTRRIFAAALLLAIVLLLPLRIALSLTGDMIAARSVEGTVWSGRLLGASLGGQPLGDLDAGMSPFSLFLGKTRVKVDGPLLHGAVIRSFGGHGGDIAMLNLPLSRTFGPVTLTAMDVAGAHVRFRGNDCAEADGRAGLRLKSFLGEQRLSGALRCSGAILAVDLLSQSAMERLSLRFPEPGRYEATLIVRASDTGQASGLAAAGFRETPVGHVLKFSGVL
jgi:general secretion pathway protein N